MVLWKMVIAFGEIIPLDSCPVLKGVMKCDWL